MDNEVYTLLLDEENSPIFMEEECKALKPIITDFVKCYVENKDQSVEEWLIPKMQEYLPERKPEEVQKMAEEIVASIEIQKEKKDSLSRAVADGRSKEDWFAFEIRKATSAGTAQKTAKETGEYLKEINQSIQQANEALYHTITTKASQHTVMSQNPNLDGFIAEQYHAQTFNLNAATKGSPYRAKVLEPEGSAYAKNSVDLVIVDGEGKTVRRYQSKYCKDAKATEKAFAHGDYRGQQKLVPEDQISEIHKKATTVIEAPDGTTSNPLTKTRAEEMRYEAQSGNWSNLDWNDVQVTDVARDIGNQVKNAAIQGAAIGAGFHIAQKLCEGEDVEAEDVVAMALASGADSGLKTAVSCALQVGSESGVLSVLPKGTSGTVITSIAVTAVENIETIGKVVDGELTLKEGMDEIQQTAVATASGLVAMEGGAAVGVAIGTVFGPVGTVVGGFIGGTVGYIAGSGIGRAVTKKAQEVRDTVVEVVNDVASSVVDGIGSFVDGLLSFVF